MQDLEFAAISIYLFSLMILSKGKIMNCDICGKPTTNVKGTCDGCTKIMDKVIRDVGPDVWNNIDDCK